MNIMPIPPGKFTEAASFGLQVFPVIRGDKRPAVSSWTRYADQAASPAELTTWDHGEYNVGIACGPESGIVVIDADSQEAIEHLQSLDLPQTPTVRTARGLHYYFRHPGFKVRNRVRLGKLALDVRGDRGYVVGPGSVHETGTLYEWVISPRDVPFAELPQAILHLLADNPRTRGQSESNNQEVEIPQQHGIERFLLISLKEACETIAATQESGRNDTLNREAFVVAMHVAGAARDWEPFANALEQAALTCGLEPSEIANTLRSAWTAGSESPTRWVQIAEDYIYLAGQHLFYHRQAGTSLDPKGFNGMFGRVHCDKGTFSEFLLSNGFIAKVQDLTYHPASPTGTIQQGELTYFNTYHPSEVVAEPGDPQPFVDFIEYLVPNHDERQHLLRAIAFTVRNPGQKLRHAILLRSRVQGVGKSILGLIWGMLLGSHNVRKVSSTELRSQFRPWLKENQLVICEELDIAMGLNTYNDLKDLITGDSEWVNEKHLKPRLWPMYSSYLFCSNLEAPLLIEDQDRRIFMIDSPAQRRSAVYYAGFVQWLAENPGVVRSYVDEIDIADFNPHAPPPMTAAKQALIERGRNPLHQEIAYHIVERSIDRDIVTIRQVSLMLESSKSNTDVAIGRALKELGCVKLGQIRTPLGGRESVWAIRNAHFWGAATKAELAEELARPHGLFCEWPTGFPAWGGNFLEIHPFEEWPAKEGGSGEEQSPRA